MAEDKVRRAVLTWWVAGILLGLIQIVAIGVKKPLGVSTQFVVADTQLINQVNPEYAENHSLISKEKYQTPGYGWWLDIGLVIGAIAAAVVTRRWKAQAKTIWWRKNHNGRLIFRFLISFTGGIFILFGSRLAHGCTSGAFASGWAQLSLSAVPLTITLFGFGMLTARLMYPKVPEIES